MTTTEEPVTRFYGDVVTAFGQSWMLMGGRNGGIADSGALWVPCVHIAAEAVATLTAFSVQRVVEGRRSARADGKVGYRAPEAIAVQDYMGLVAEYAVSLYLDMPFRFRYDPINEYADIGDDIQVRSTDYLHGGLIIRPHERHRDQRHVLAVVHREYVAIVGWKNGADVLDLGREHSWWDQHYNYWKVPQWELAPMSTFVVPERSAPRWGS